nr:Shedu anti-phage system protein SduA domain-containing protein [Bradyrhizobium sp. BRP56]
MLTARANDEPAFQEFFCTYPQLLDPLAVQVWSQPDFHGAAEPDFVIRRADDSYLVVEIECPGKMLLTKGGQFSHETVHAEKQTLDYESFLSERVVEARMHFPNYRRADCLAVIGLETALTTEQRQNLDRANGRRQNLRVVGFDWLLDRARTMISNIGEGEIEVIKRHRVV